jgi:hypothetical protein
MRTVSYLLLLPPSPSFSYPPSLQPHLDYHHQARAALYTGPEAAALPFPALRGRHGDVVVALTATLPRFIQACTDSDVRVGRTRRLGEVVAVPMPPLGLFVEPAQERRGRRRAPAPAQAAHGPMRTQGGSQARGGGLEEASGTTGVRVHGGSVCPLVASWVCQVVPGVCCCVA